MAWLRTATSMITFAFAPVRDLLLCPSRAIYHARSTDVRGTDLWPVHDGPRCADPRRRHLAASAAAQTAARRLPGSSAVALARSGRVDGKHGNRCLHHGALSAEDDAGDSGRQR